METAEQRHTLISKAQAAQNVTDAIAKTKQACATYADTLMYSGVSPRRIAKGIRHLKITPEDTDAS